MVYPLRSTELLFAIHTQHTSSLVKIETIFSSFSLPLSLSLSLPLPLSLPPSLSLSLPLSLSQDSSSLATPFANPLDDLSPFFQKQYVKGHASDIFSAYGRLMTEILLVLPCQVGAEKREGCGLEILFYFSVEEDE